MDDVTKAYEAVKAALTKDWETPGLLKEDPEIRDWEKGLPGPKVEIDYGPGVDMSSYQVPDPNQPGKFIDVGMYGSASSSTNTNYPYGTSSINSYPQYTTSVGGSWPNTYINTGGDISGDYFTMPQINVPAATDPTISFADPIVEIEIPDDFAGDVGVREGSKFYTMGDVYIVACDDPELGWTLRNHRDNRY